MNIESVLSLFYVMPLWRQKRCLKRLSTTSNTPIRLQETLCYIGALVYAMLCHTIYPQPLGVSYVLLEYVEKD
jgi:hypothetical protein